MALAHLFTPVRLGHLTLRNRIVSTPHATKFGKDGYITERYIRYYAEKAKGGAGLLQCFGSMSVHPTAPVLDWGGIKNWDDSSLPTFTEFAARVHDHGAAVMAQITHRGRRGWSAPAEQPLLAPSPIPEQMHPEIPHELDRATIREIVQAFGDAARRLQRAGFDGADLCAFARHLIDQFWNPAVNRRTDDYGGSFENRMRFAVEVIDAIRAAVGREFILGIRVTGDEFLDGGLTLDDTLDIVRYLHGLGQLDYFTVSGSSGETTRLTQKMMPFADAPQGLFAPFAARIREIVDVPIIYAGKVADPRFADQLIGSGVCDLVAMTRALIADPHMPEKARAERFDDIRLCVGMQDGCLGRSARGLFVSCSQNPVTGREGELAELAPASVAKRVVVVGGGPAGLEAARIAALRGHQVVLYEKASELGGQVSIAGKAPLRPGYDLAAHWLARQLAKTTAKVHLGTEATADAVLAERPDAVVVATGAVPRRPELPGADLPGVVTVEDVLLGRMDGGARCVVVDATGRIHAGLAADALARRGKTVVVVTPYHTVCDQTEPSTKEPLYERLYAGNVTMIVDTGLVGIGTGGPGGQLVVSLRNEYTGRVTALEGIGLVVLSYGGSAVDTLYRALEGKVPQLFLVGDAMAPRLLHDAILEATRAARRI